MTYYASTQPNNARVERINHEVEAIRTLGYPCEPQQGQDGRSVYIVVHLHRDTQEGQQPISLYLNLDDGFPETRPEMVVTVALPDGQKRMGEANEAPIEIESKARLSWRSDSMLYQIVREVADSVQSVQIRIVGGSFTPPAVEPAGTTHAPPPLPASPGSPSLAAPARRRSAKGVIAAVLITGAVLLFGGAGAIYMAFFYDPCGDARQLAERNLGAIDLVALGQAVHTLEDMRARGQQGERGSCAALVNDPGLLRDAYLRYGQQLLAGDSLDQAEQTYQAARQLDSRSQPAQAGLDAVAVARVQPLWSTMKSLWPANTLESWPRVVDALEKIRAISPQAISPDDGLSVTLNLYRAQVAWGDLLYAQEQPDAAKHYAAARALLPADPLAADRLDWTERRRRLREAHVADWPALLEELQQLAAQTPSLSDPAGRSINQWLYTAHVGYAQALLGQEQSGATAGAVLQQAQAALELASASDDNGAAARLLVQQASDRLRAYNLTAEPLDASALSKVLRERNLPEKLRGQVVNLIVLTPVANMPLTLIGSKGSQQLVSNRAGMAFAALDNDRYRLSLIDGEGGIEVVLDYATAPAYLVRVTPH
jgi:tetratricopeptide (TPR) repeat protein